MTTLHTPFIKFIKNKSKNYDNIGFPEFVKLYALYTERRTNDMDLMVAGILIKGKNYNIDVPNVTKFKLLKLKKIDITESILNIADVKYITMGKNIFKVNYHGFKKLFRNEPDMMLSCKLVEQRYHLYTLYNRTIKSIIRYHT